jgi:hypothetical protein
MPAGYAHIVKRAVAQGMPAPQYQFTFHDGFRDFAKTFTEPELIVFLTSDLGLKADIADRILCELHGLGDATVSDLRISDNDASFMGLNIVQSEY